MSDGCTALLRYQDRWAVEDPVLDYIIQRHELAVLDELVAAFMEGWGDDVSNTAEMLQVPQAS